MRSPQPSSIVIACPHCGTRYQVPPETVGAKGRQVACAHCGKSWLAERPAPPPLPPPADDDRLFSPVDEESLDKSFAAEEREVSAQQPTPLKSGLKRGEVPPPEVMRSIAEIKAALAPKAKADEGAVPTPVASPSADGKAMSKAWGLLKRRHLAFSRTLPTARLSRVLRFVGFGLLAGTLIGGVLFRTDIVRTVPDLAGLYAAVGLKVNVVGLDFTDVSTLVSRRGDTDVISVNATIIGLESRRVAVPAVIVTLLDANDKAVYQWSVVTRARDLEPGEVIGVSTELTQPPAGVARVRLSFADGATSGDVPITETKLPEEAAH